MAWHGTPRLQQEKTILAHLSPFRPPLLHPTPPSPLPGGVWRGSVVWCAMPPKHAEPPAAEPLDDLTPEERAHQAQLQEKQMQAKQHALLSTEVCGRRLVEEMEAVDRKFIAMEKAGAPSGDEGQCNAAGRFYLYVRVLPGNRALSADTLELVCSAEDTVNDLKTQIGGKIKDTFCPPPDLQRLSYLGTPVAEGTLASNALKPGSTLHLTLEGAEPCSAALAPPPVRCAVAVS